MYVLNYTEKYINFLAAFITMLIFAVLLILDVYIFQSQYNRYQNNLIISNTKIYKAYVRLPQKVSTYQIQNNYDIKTENIYTTISDKAINANKQDNVVKELSKTEEEKKGNKVNSSSKNQENAELASINIYSTNKWRIKIPKLNLDAPISEGTSQESLRRTVGHFDQTDKWNGNVALAAHNRGYKCNFFQEIKNLQKNDLIIYSTEKGERRYKVTTNKIIQETDWSYIQNTKDNRITLITCEANKRAYRRCIQAVEIL